MTIKLIRPTSSPTNEGEKPAIKERKPEHNPRPIARDMWRFVEFLVLAEDRMLEFSGDNPVHIATIRHLAGNIASKDSRSWRWP
jgi:hypothetical protein